MVKKRRVLVTLEVETSIALAILRDAGRWERTLHRAVDMTVHQAQANVIRTPRTPTQYIEVKRAKARCTKRN